MPALSVITKKKKRAAFLILSAVSEHLKAGWTRYCYVRQLNIRRKENGEYHDLIQEMRLIVLHYKREFPLATSLQFFFLRGAKNSACKLQFFLQERIADFLAEGAIVFAREIARSCKKRSYSFCNFLSQRLQVEV